MAVRLSNNASTQLAASITATDTTIHVAAGTGGLFPALPAVDVFPITVVGADNTTEIMRVTARAGDVFTVVRAQEDTTARAFPIGSRVECRLTAGTFTEMMENKLERGGGTLTGPVVSDSTIDAQGLGVDGEAVWHAGNFDPDGKLGNSGSQQIDGDALTINGTQPRATFIHGGSAIFSVGVNSDGTRLTIGTGADMSDPLLSVTSSGEAWIKGIGLLTAYVTTQAESIATTKADAAKTAALASVASTYVDDVRLGALLEQAPVAVNPGPGWVLTAWSGTDGYGIGSWRPIQVKRGGTWYTIGVA